MHSVGDKVFIMMPTVDPAVCNTIS